MTVRIAAMLQARTGSSRLPGKVLMPIGGRPMIAQTLDRLAGRGYARRFSFSRPKRRKIAETSARISASTWFAAARTTCWDALRWRWTGPTPT